MNYLINTDFERRRYLGHVYDMTRPDTFEDFKKAKEIYSANKNNVDSEINKLIEGHTGRPNPQISDLRGLMIKVLVGKYTNSSYVESLMFYVDEVNANILSISLSQVYFKQTSKPNAEELRNIVFEKWNAYIKAQNELAEEGRNSQGFIDKKYVDNVNKSYREWQLSANDFHTFLIVNK